MTLFLRQSLLTGWALSVELGSMHIKIDHQTMSESVCLVRRSFRALSGSSRGFLCNDLTGSLCPKGMVPLYNRTMGRPDILKPAKPFYGNSQIAKSHIDFGIISTPSLAHTPTMEGMRVGMIENEDEEERFKYWWMGASTSLHPPPPSPTSSLPSIPVDRLVDYPFLYSSLSPFFCACDIPHTHPHSNLRTWLEVLHRCPRVEEAFGMLSHPAL